MPRGDRPKLLRGDLLPEIANPPPGVRARRLVRRLVASEAPGTILGEGNGPPVWVEAVGANVLDVDDNRYLDLTGGFGVATIGHRHPEVVETIRRQAGRLLHGLGDLHPHRQRIALAEELRSRAPFDDARVYFAVSGSDAVEIALKTALLVTGRPGLVAFEGSYHGSTLGALAVTGRSRFREPFAEHLHSEVHRLPWGSSPEALGVVLAEGEIGAVILEPIQGRAGVRLPPPDWLPAVRRLTSDHGALLILDEILTGGGRTGSFWAVTEHDVIPDLVCAGKGLAGGLPLGLVLGPASLLSAWPGQGEALHTGTFLAHPLVCAAARANLAVLDELLAAPRTSARSRQLASGLSALRRRFPGRIRAVRGRGHLWGLDLGRPNEAFKLARIALREGLLLLPSGNRGEVVELLPPLTLTEEQADAAVELLGRAVARISR
ncbi:MAG: aspartate aminotransferase family protein [Thermoanaerobaculia bacterium]|nr:aspartate aminotransferase family protein [Thermoanaerobaculia bacterium]